MIAGLTGYRIMTLHHRSSFDIDRAVPGTIADSCWPVARSCPAAGGVPFKRAMKYGLAPVQCALAACLEVISNRGIKSQIGISTKKRKEKSRKSQKESKEPV